MHVFNDLLTKSKVFLGKSQTEPCSIDWAIARSTQQGQGQKFYCEDRMLKVNKLFIVWLFALFLAHGHYGRVILQNQPIRAHAISVTNTNHGNRECKNKLPSNNWSCGRSRWNFSKCYDFQHCCDEVKKPANNLSYFKSTQNSQSSTVFFTRGWH